MTIDPHIKSDLYIDPHIRSDLYTKLAIDQNIHIKRYVYSDRPLKLLTKGM